MPRGKNPEALVNIVIRNEFTLKEGSNDLYTCHHCDNEKIINGKYLHNVLAHIKIKHKTLFEQKYGLNEKSKRNLEIDRLKLLQNYTEIVTCNMRPYAALEDTGFKKSIAEKLNRLDQVKRKIIVPEEVQKYISRTASSIRNEIRKECENKLISIMADIVTKGKICILGIIIRYVYNGKLCERCLGMIELKKSHTAKYLSTEVNKLLEAVGINGKILIGYTTDNARNMQATVEQCSQSLYGKKKATSLNKQAADQGETITENEINLDVEANTGYFDVSENVHRALEILSSEIYAEELADIQQTISDDDDALQMIMEDINSPTALVEEALELVIRDNQSNVQNEFNDIFNIRCAAHTLQLAVRDAIKNTEFKDIIVACRKVALLLRKQDYLNTAKEKGIPVFLPRLSSATRWNSEFRMVS